MTVQGTALTGDPTTGRRVSPWWIVRAVVLAATVLAVVCHLLEPAGASAYSTGVAIGTSATFVAVLFVLINGPQPRWATRWAWFWLILNPALVITAALFLIVSGPVSPTREPVPQSGRRLTGGWAFLIAVVVLSGFRARIA